MAQLTREQIAGYAKQGGFTGDDVTIAVAVAMAESGGDTNSHNGTPPDNSYGLWQINMYNALGPARRKQFNLTSNDELFNPVTNAKAAYAIKTGSGWNAWTTYTTGKYKKFLDKGFVGTVKDGIGVVTDKATPDLSSVSSAINSVGQNIFKGVASAIAATVGLVLIVVAIAVLLRKQIPVKKLVTKGLG